MISRRSACWTVFVLGAHTLVLSSSAVSFGAEPSAHQLRTWTDSTGKHSIQAEFVDLKDGKVRLRKQDGTEIAIAIDKLSDADRKFVRQQSKGRAASGAAPRQLAVDLGKGVKLEMVLVPAGEFLMGSPDSDEIALAPEKPQHRVRISKPFYLGKYEVTQQQWQALVDRNPSAFKNPQNPVDSVSWEDCQIFLARLNEKIGGKYGEFGLPTEAQWEYACRAGTTTRWSFGDNDLVLDEHAWYSSNSGDTTHPVGEKKPNAWGLYDMQGNVWEWCSDWYREDDYKLSPRKDPTGATSGPRRVLRGGSYNDIASNVRSARRMSSQPTNRYNNDGFRVLMAPK
jgi:formylglycine-generating enzyme required for sulfatase activity